MYTLTTMSEKPSAARSRDAGITFDLLGPSSAGGPATSTEAKMLQRLSQLEELVEATVEEERAACVAPPALKVFDPTAFNYPLPRNFLLSVVIPVYNEEKTIRTVLERIEALPIPTQIIIVDDCSTDRTREFLQAEEERGIHEIVYQPINQGKGAALRTGFRRAKGQIVVVQDADLEYDPRDILQLLPPILSKDADVVYGSRFLGEKPQDPSWIHRLGNAILTQASNLTTGLHLTDMETCYKAFRRDVITKIDIQQNRFGFEPEITARLARRKHTIVEVPISYAARSYQEGKKIGWKDLVSTLYCIVRYGLLP